MARAFERFRSWLTAALAAASGMWACANAGAMELSPPAPGLAASYSVTQAMAALPETPSVSRIRAMIGSAWEDATRTWADLLGRDFFDSESPRIAFVPKVKATHCYGLYVSAGPVYCSGNNTVFVSLDEMRRLQTALPGFGDGGLTLLVAHELGHHVQKITGRFRLLSAMMRTDPENARELIRRFELEADCLAGLWAGHSRFELSEPSGRPALIAAAEAIGDDRAVASGIAPPSDPASFTHGSASQRKRWFETGLTAGALDVCNVLSAPSY
jgi:uncharacterized protein